jgi:hypothetical protein
LHFPDLEQRHQAIFGLEALFALVAYFDFPSGQSRFRYCRFGIGGGGDGGSRILRTLLLTIMNSDLAEYAVRRN